MYETLQTVFLWLLLATLFGFGVWCAFAYTFAEEIVERDMRRKGLLPDDEE